MNHPIFSSDTRVEVETLIDQSLGKKDTPKVLEAGCGSTTKIRIPNGSHVVGIDISQEELDKNTNLSEKICADIQSYEFPPERFDLVICWDVLEHLRFPQLALDRLVRTLKTDGLLLLKMPNRNSLKALVTRFTPYRFHRLIYRFIYGSRYGGAGMIPFPTCFDSSIAPKRIEAFAKETSLEVQFQQLYEARIQRQFYERLGIKDSIVTICEAFVRALSCNTLTLTGSDCLYLYRKTNIGAAR